MREDYEAWRGTPPRDADYYSRDSDGEEEDGEEE
jgi:hypothetical protein